jgi:hypothetical protein
MLYRGMDRAELRDTNNDLAAVRSAPNLFADWAAEWRMSALRPIWTFPSERAANGVDLFKVFGQNFQQKGPADGRQGQYSASKGG